MLNFDKLINSLKYSKEIFISFLGLYGRVITNYKISKKHNEILKHFKTHLNCNYRYLTSYYMFVGYNHLEFKPHYGALIKDSHRLVDIYPRILALDSSQESLDALVNTLEGSLCPINIIKYDQINDNLLNLLQTYDSISLPLVLDEIAGDEYELEKFILKLKSHLNPGGLIAGFSTSGLGFNHSNNALNYINAQNKDKNWFNLNRDITNLEDILSKHFFDVSTEIVGSCLIFRASLPPKKVDTLSHKLNIKDVEGKYLDLY